MKYPAQDKKTAVFAVLKGRESVAEVARRLGVSRKTVYSWINKYKKAPSRRKKIVLADAYRSGETHPKAIYPLAKAKLIRLIIKHPEWGIRKYSRALKSVGINLGNFGVFKLLQGLGASTYELRKNFKRNWAGPGRLTSDIKLSIVKRAIEGKETISTLSQEFGIARKTIYKWIKRYQNNTLKGLSGAVAVSDNYPQGEAHPKAIYPQVSQEILSFVAQNPTLSVHQLARLVDVSTYAVWKILDRYGLNNYQQRYVYAQHQAPAVETRPSLKFFDRVRLVWEEFVNGLAPAPPPRLVTIWSFLRNFALASLVSFSVIYSSFWWINYITFRSPALAIGTIFATVALTAGTIFFLYSLKYYISLAIVLSFSQQPSFGKPSEGKGRGILSWILGIANGRGKAGLTTEASAKAVGLTPNLEHVTLERYPKVSVHIPLYNEKTVVERILNAVTSFEYPTWPAGGYEVIIADDSTDDTSLIIKSYIKNNGVAPRSFSGVGWTLVEAEVRPGVTLKHLHRTSRSGFKGGALREALKHTDPKAEFITVFDADFVPYPDTLELFLKYFQVTAGGLDFSQVSRIAAVQGYQWHVLNKSENWITRGVRSEYAGSYVIERSGAEIYTGLKQISGAVYMIRRDVLDEVGWETSITEDFQLTLKLYEKGYKVVYTPYIQAPAECVSTLKRLIRQRMRWAEGHSNNIRRMFTRLLFGRWTDSNVVNPKSQILNPKQYLNSNDTNSKRFEHSDLENSNLFRASDLDISASSKKKWIPSPLTLSEKLEFLYLSPYYLQAFFFLLGTISWLISETIFQAKLPFWTSLWGWSLVLTNFLSLPLMNAVGLFLEESEEKDYLGLTSFAILSYVLVPFQAYASLKGFVEKQEGPWFRTPKTGRITDIFRRGTFYRLISGILPGRSAAERIAVSGERIGGFNLDAKRYNLNAYLSLATANNKFNSFKLTPRRMRWHGKVALVFVLTVSLFIHSLAFRAETVEATWYDTNWQFRKSITIDFTKVSSGPHTDFPVLVSLASDTDLAADAQDDGDDILFTSSDKITKLSHEIESFNGTTGALVAWVKVPSLSSTANTVLYLYYGNAAAANQQDAVNVWDANYVATLHLKESPNGTLNELNDSSGTGNHGQTFGMAAANSVAGKIGNGLNFVKADQLDQIRVYDSVSMDDIADEGTVEFWINYVVAPNAVDPQLTFVHSQRFSGSRGMEHAYNPNGNFFMYPETTVQAWSGTTNPVNSAQWHLVSWRWKFSPNKDHDLFVDGAQKTFDAGDNSALWTGAAITDDLYFGGIVDRNTRWLDGKLDEIRISNIARSTDWISTEYNNQNSPSTFYSLGSEEQVPELIVLLLPLAILIPYFVKYMERRKKMYLGVRG